MKRSFWPWLLGCLAALSLGLTGCNKSPQADASKPITLKGAAEVLAKLDSKDFEGAVAGLAQIKMEITEEQMPEYRRLRDKVAEVMVPNLADNESAKKAYRALGALETGR